MAANLQSLLRFLSQDAKIPLAKAMSSVKDLQAQHLDTPELLAKAKPETLSTLFPEDKQAKQILTAAKRVSKKRAAGTDEAATEPTAREAKRKRNRANDGSFFSRDAQSPAELEASLSLPSCDLEPQALEQVVLTTNRAPLVLAFILQLLKYTMPAQPLSSRLSLAQAYVSVNSRKKAVSLGLEKGLSAEEEGVGEGQPVVRVAGREVRVLRRWGYDSSSTGEDKAGGGGGEVEGEVEGGGNGEGAGEKGEEEPALWALDLEALKKSNSSGSSLVAAAAGGGASGLPIYTPQSARAYILKSFDTAAKADDESAGPKGKKKPTATAKMAEKERNLGMLLRAIDLLYLSWLEGSEPEELDRRVWGWYVKVRPDVENGVAGWGGRGEVKLAEILALRREATRATRPP